MRLADIVNGPWAITSPMLTEIKGIYAAHVRGEKISIPDVEARIGRPLDSDGHCCEIINGVALIRVEGVIGKRMNLFTRISGGASSELVKRDFQEAIEDPGVRAVLIYADGPGGTVDGTQELGEAIYQARGTKPIVVFSDGMLCSAYYWFASAADRIFISGETTMVGSIGVIVSHEDCSRKEEMSGVKTTEIVSGKYKNAASPHAPLTEIGREVMQERSDYVYTAFVNDVARNRGVSVDECLANMADGRIFSGTQARRAGLVDGVSTLDLLLAQLSGGVMPDPDECCTDDETGQDEPVIVVTPADEPADNPDDQAQPMPGKEGKCFTPSFQPQKTGAAAGSAVGPKGAAMKITREMLQAQAPDVLEAILAEGATAERARITAIQTIPAVGHAELVAAAIGDGKSTAGDVALAIMKYDENVRAGKLKEMIEDAPTPTTAAEPGDESVEEAAEVNRLQQLSIEAANAGR